jgi:hypothetical protein
MRTAFTRVLGRRRTLVLLLLAVLLASTTTWAFWAAKSSGSASGHIGSLPAPQISSATPGGGTVALSWTAVSAPAGGTVSYYVSRDGGAASSACPSSTTPGTQTSCTDTGVPTGSHKYTVTAVWHSWSAKSESASAQVMSGAATHLVLTPATTTPTAGAADNLTITAKDAANNTVASYTGSRNLKFSGAGTIGLLHPTVSDNNGNPIEFGATAGTAITFSAGVASVSGTSNGVMTLYKAGTASVKVSDGLFESGDVSVTVSPGTAVSLALSTATRTAGTAFSEELVAKDSSGNTATSYSGTRPIVFSGPANSPNTTAPKYPSSVAFSGGEGKASITLYDVQSTTLTAKEGSISGTSASFSVNAGSAATFTVPTPASQTAGTAFNETLSALDAYGNTATSYTGSQPIVFSGPANSPNGKTPTYPALVSFSSGVGTASITLFNASATTSLTATQGTITGNSAGSFIVGPASPASLTLAAASTSPTAGEADNLTVTALDSYGNTATSYTGNRSLTFGGANAIGTNKPTVTDSSGVARLFGTSETITFASGIAKVSGSGNGLMKLYAAEAAKLTVTDTVISNNTSPLSVTVAAGAISTISLTTPGTQTAGTEFNLTITAKDSFGNGVSGSQALTFSGPSNAPDGTAPTYPANVTFTAGEGKAPITLTKAQSTTITVAQGTPKGTSGSFTVAPATASELSLAAADTTPEAGVSDSLTITALDTYGNTATSYAGTRNLTFGGANPIGTNKPTVTDSGNVARSFGTSETITFASGIAKVSGSGNGVMKLYAAETAKLTVTETATGISGSPLSVTVENAPFSITVANPGTQTAGTPFNLNITAKDTYGNLAGGALSLTFSGPESSPSEKAPSYPSTVSFTAGAGTASVTLYDAGSPTITVARGSTNGKTGSFTVNAGSASKLAWSGASSSFFFAEEEGLCLFTCTWSGIGKNHTWSAKVSVTDASGNVVSNIGSGHTVTWTGGPSVGTILPSSLTLPSSGSATTSSSVTYTSPNNNGWSSDTFAAHTSGYGDATVLLKK